MARLISYDYIRQKALADPDSGEAVVYLQDIAEAPTVDAVPVSELKKLRDYLYAEDLIFMRGLAELNKLIANCGMKMDEVSK